MDKKTPHLLEAGSTKPKNKSIVSNTHLLTPSYNIKSLGSGHKNTPRKKARGE